MRSGLWVAALHTAAAATHAVHGFDGHLARHLGTTPQHSDDAVPLGARLLANFLWRCGGLCLDAGGPVAACRPSSVTRTASSTDRAMHTCEGAMPVTRGDFVSTRSTVPLLAPQRCGRRKRPLAAVRPSLAVGGRGKESAHGHGAEQAA